MIKNFIENKKIIVDIDGGCGNQLFQLLACKTLALNLKRQPAYSDLKCGRFRNFEVEKIAKFLGFEKYNEFNYNEIPKLSEKDLCHPALFSAFPNKIGSIDENILIFGTFASHRIHNKGVIDDLKNFVLNYQLKIHNLDYPFIAVHLRELLGTWGDKPLDRVDNLDFLFYQRAFKLIMKEESYSKIKKVIIFCDLHNNKKNSKLIPLLKRFLKNNGYEIIFGDDLFSTPLDIILLMSRAKIILASNSTFSWWGAYLSNAKVYCPIYSLWEPALSTPESWVQINDGNLNPKTWHAESGYENINLSKIQQKNIKRNTSDLIPKNLFKIIIKLGKIISFLKGKTIDKLWNLRFSSLLS